MQAIWRGHLIADSDQTLELGGYPYFPPASVRMEFLHKAPKTAADDRCPHGVQFFDVGDETRSSPRAAWRYEAPRGSYAHAVQWIGFWNEVELRR